MDLSENKALACRFVETIGELDPDKMLPMLADNFAIKVMFRSKGHPLVAEVDKAGFIKQLESVGGMFPNRCKHEVRGVIAEGDMVAVESECHAIVGGGRTYNNLFHFFVRIRGDQIVEVKEYADFLHAKEVLFPDYVCVEDALPGTGS